jgi:hypothetical protein
MPEIAEQIRTCSEDPEVVDRIQQQYLSAATQDWDRVWAVRLSHVDRISIDDGLLDLKPSGIRLYGVNFLSTQFCCRSCLRLVTLRLSTCVVLFIMYTYYCALITTFYLGLTG